MSDKRTKRLKNIARIKFLIFGTLIFFIYELLGVIISYARHPKISGAYKESFNPYNCYSDSVSHDRARIIEDNKDALNLRLRMINNAKKQIILSTFDFHSDRSGKDMISTLIEAAKRGVKIKIVVDGFSAFMQMNGNPYFYALSSEENVEIKIYNRLNFLKPWKTMGRMHDKYLIADDNLYLLGGRNTFNIFLGDYGYKNYDREVLVYTDEVSEKSSIHSVENYFSEVWKLKACKPFRKRSLFVSGKKVDKAREELKNHYENLISENPKRKEAPDYKAITFETNKITLLSNPTHIYSKEPTLFYSLTELMKTTEGPIKLHTPYIICNDWMYGRFKEVCDSNKNVTMMTNSPANNGNPFGASDFKKNKGKLFDTGLKIREYEGGVSYHGKSMTIGDEITVIGSFNMDMRSAYLDTELMLVIDSAQVKEQLQDYMEHYEAHSVEAFADGTYDIPEGVTRQKMDTKKKILVAILTVLNGLRFLM